MRKIILIEGPKNAGKSEWINKKANELLESEYTELKIYNKGDQDNTIYILKKKNDTQNDTLVILNSGSDTKEIINEFSEILDKYKDAVKIYTAIRPKKDNPLLHKWMIDALGIQKSDTIETITLPQ